MRITNAQQGSYPDGFFGYEGEDDQKSLRRYPTETVFSDINGRLDALEDETATHKSFDTIADMEAAVDDFEEGDLVEVTNDPLGYVTDGNGFWRHTSGEWVWKYPTFPSLITYIQSNARQSLFLDPHFEVVRNRGFTFGGKRLISSLGPNGVWDPTYSWADGRGAWEVTTGGTHFAIATWFTVGEIVDYAITTGEKISAAMEIIAPLNTNINVTYYFFSTTEGTAIGSGVQKQYVGTGSRQVVNHENLSVPSGANGIMFYIQEGATTGTFRVLKHWVVRGVTAGDEPPARRISQLQSLTAVNGTGLSSVPNSVWITGDDELFARMAKTASTGEPAVQRAFGGDVAGFACPFKWNVHIDGVIIYLGVETPSAPLRLRFIKNDLTTVLGTARIEAAAKRRGPFRFKFNEDLHAAFLSNGLVALDVVYIAIDVPGGGSEIVTYAPMGFPSTIEDVNFSTYPQLYTEIGNDWEDSLEDWLTVADDNSLPMAWCALAFTSSAEDEEVAPHPDQPVIGPYFTMFGSRETNIYLANARSSVDPRRFSVSSGFNAVKMQDERIVGVPGSTNFYGTFLTLNVLDDQSRIIKSITARADSSVPGLGNDAFKVMLIGDSHTAPARIGQRMLDMSAYYTSSIQIELLGAKEGDSGVSVSGPFPFLAAIDGVTNTDNRHEAKGGFGFGGDGTDDSSYYSTHANNPFRNGTKKFDFDNYQTVNSVADPDAVVLWGCSNDVFAKQNGNIIVTEGDAHAAMDTTIDNLDRIIGLTVDADVVSILDTVPSAKIIIVMPAAVSTSQDGFALAYSGGGAGMTSRRYKRNNVIARWRLLEHYNTAAMRAAGVYLFDAGPVMDPINGLPTTEDWSTSNTRPPSHSEPTASQNTLAVLHRPTDPIHPYKIKRLDFFAAFSTVSGDNEVTVHTDEPHGIPASSGPDVYRIRFDGDLGVNGDVNSPPDNPHEYREAPTVSGLNMEGTWTVTSVTETTFTFNHSGNANATTGAPTGDATGFFLEPGGFEQMGEALWIFFEAALRSTWFTRSGAGP